MNTFKIITLGCKVNQYEAQLMREQMQHAGLEEVNPRIPADLYIINTCTVTADADRECRRFIRKSIKENPNAKIIAAGCYTEKDADKIKAIDKDIIILPNKDKISVSVIARLTKSAEAISKHEIASLTSFARNDELNHISRFHGRTKAFIKVQDGCDNFCSYCKVPYVRGNPTSRDAAEIIKEAQALINNGYKELVLTGVCLGSYGKDLNEDISLSDIVKSIISLEGDFRIRLSSIEIQDVDYELSKIIRKSSKICKHLHIPLQSGDDEILKKMNRKYSSPDFIKRIKQIKSAIPGLALSTDVIVGFPGETEYAFNNTVKCLKKINPMRTHIFTYSPREGTAAYLFKNTIAKEVASIRYKNLKALTDAMANQYYEHSKHTKQRILVENTRTISNNMLSGYTDFYVKYTFDGPDEWVGNFVHFALL